jgi:3-phosphoshikimate 1-carboxyvinyltransferase
MSDYPDRLEIVPLAASPNATVRVPGSKSITNRALVLAALSGKGCTLHCVLRSEDTEVMVAALRSLGFGVETDWGKSVVRVQPNYSGRVIPASHADLFVGNSGTSMRFLTAIVALGQGRYRIDGVPRMRERPIEDLLQALQQLGVSARCEKNTGCPPVVIESSGMRGGSAEVRGEISSQFLSGLLMAVPSAQEPVEIRILGTLVSQPYVQMTITMMRQFGLGGIASQGSSYFIAAPQEFGLTEYLIEPDASAASYFFASAAVTDGEIRLPQFGGDQWPGCMPRDSALLQGDVRFVDVLRQMGCRVHRGQEELTVHGAPLHGIDIDMNDISDTVMTLAAVACFAEGPTTIRNVAHIRHKETDRLAALATELRRLGAGVDEFADGLTITPKPLHGAEVETYNDHRMAMSLALIGLRVPGVVIKNPGCVAKTYPDFFRDLEALR